MTTTASDTATRAQVAQEIRRRQRFVIASHVRPDGDAIGSQLAMAYALRAMGKDVRIVNRDPAPPPLQAFPGVHAIELADRVDDPGDAVIVMESGDLSRTGVSGFERGFVINIDHHLGNTMYGAVNWFDLSAAACGEMVYDVVRALGVPLTVEIATHVYVAVLTDTGGFHYSNITPRTFAICGACTEAGVNPSAIARAVYDSNRIGRLKLFRAVLNDMHFDPSERIATLAVTRQMAADAGATYEDTEGLVNLPLTVKEIEAVIFFKQERDDQYRVSFRSKGTIDVGAVAKEFGGGGHKNAAGCTVSGPVDALRRMLVEKVERAMSASAAL